MSTLKSIDRKKPLNFYGCSTKFDPEFKEFVEKLNLPQLLMVSDIVTKEFELSSEYTAELLSYISWHSQASLFEENLQCFSETAAGEPILTGWFSLDEFFKFLQNSDDASPKVKEALALLTQFTKDWESLGVEDFNFSGYEEVN